MLQEARAEREAMMKEAREIKAKMIADAKEEAQAEANKMIRKHKQLLKVKRKQHCRIKSHVAELSVEIAEKVVKKNCLTKTSN